jgi:predicted nucleic acid-binding protein
MIFLDTSGIYALADSRDLHHEEAIQRFERLLESQEQLVTHNYVIFESIALLQARLGLSQALKFARESSAFEIEWVNGPLHDSALAALQKSGKRNVSFVDHVSFLVMKRRSLTTAFAFDPHFENEGFRLLE